MSQVVAGSIEEGEGSEPLWDQVDQDMAWRFDTLQELVTDLELFVERIPEVSARLELTETIV